MHHGMPKLMGEREGELLAAERMVVADVVAVVDGTSPAKQWVGWDERHHRDLSVRQRRLHQRQSGASVPDAAISRVSTAKRRIGAQRLLTRPGLPSARR